jgi:hypothetical protein
MRIQEIIIIDKETKEVIAQIPFNESESPVILKKGLDMKVSYNKPFKTKNKGGKLVLIGKIKKTMSDLEEKRKKIADNKKNGIEIEIVK